MALTKYYYKIKLFNKRRIINQELLKVSEQFYMPQELHPYYRSAVSNGKRFRPLLLLMTHELFGGTWRDALPLACAIELLHKASLVHDDLVDGDGLRRGKEAFWKTHGEKQAVIIGDVLIGLSLQLVNQWGADTRNYLINQKIISTFSKSLTHTALGESLDIHFETVSNVSTQSAIEMTLLKSGSLIAASMKLGAISANADENSINNIAQLGEHLGVVFQIMNDVNSLTGIDKDSKGDYQNDFSNHKKNLVTVILKQQGVLPEQINQLSKNELEQLLKPVMQEIELRKQKSSKIIHDLPKGEITNLFMKLLNELTEKWYWNK